MSQSTGRPGEKANVANIKCAARESIERFKEGASPTVNSQEKLVDFAAELCPTCMTQEQDTPGLSSHEVIKTFANVHETGL